MQLESLIKKELSNKRKIVLTQNSIEIINKLIDAYPKMSSKITPRLANQHGTLSWYLLFDKQFKKAEKSARKGLKINNKAEWIHTNLALSLLHQGKLNEAKSIYLQMKSKTLNDRSYSSIFLDDIDELEKAGITHPDVNKIRSLLNLKD